MKTWTNGEILYAEDLNANFNDLSLKTKDGLIIAVMGDSISTQENLNAPEIEVTQADIGIPLSAYIAYNDYYVSNLTIGGHTITSDEIGAELSFTPTSDDVGKQIGVPLNYNTKVWQTWWQYMKEIFGCEVIPVCWSGSSITSHEDSNSKFKSAHAWHDSQIRKLGKRIPGSMNRLSPDIIIIYRGTNDTSHTPYSLITSGYFDNAKNWTYPTTDVTSSGGYGLKEAYSLTIKKIRATYPKAKIVLATLNNFKRVNFDKFPTNNGIYSLTEYNDMVREIADFFGCETIDFDKDGITFENCYDEGYVRDSSTNSTHPNNNGHLIMGQQAVCDLVNKLHICDITPINNNNGRLFDKMILEKTYINSSTGLIQRENASSDASAYFTIAYYPVEEKKTYYINSGGRYSFINKYDEVVSHGNLVSNYITAPTGALYLHVCTKYDDIKEEDLQISLKQ